MTEGSETLKVESRGQILWAAFAESPTSSLELAQLFEAASGDPDTRVIVLTGAAERAFSVGGGGAAAPEDRDGREAWWVNGMREARAVVLAALGCEKPIVGRINGHAIGKGCSLALCCDVTIMVEDAKIGDTHVKVGLAAGDGGSLLWPALVGPVLARRHLLTGDLLTGREAADIGLVTEAVARDALDARTIYWAERLMQGSPLAVALTKRAINAALLREAASHMDLSLGLETLTFMTQDHREGTAALTERRTPRFQGR
jgi:enoyl-CoA hydratase